MIWSWEKREPNAYCVSMLDVVTRTEGEDLDSILG